MKLRKLSQVVLAAAVGIGSSFGLTSCVQSHTIGYFFVTGHQYNQVSAFKIDNNTGNLTQQGGSIGSGGVNPIDAIVTQGGKFLYILNAGCANATAYPNAKYPCASGTAATAGNVSLFTIGGGGVVTFQASYSTLSTTSHPVTLTTDSTGSYLYLLDQNAPTTSNVPETYQAGGAVEVSSINPDTGRLSPILNQQIKDNSGSQLEFFPVGQDPVWFKVFNSYLFTIDRNNGASANATYVNVYSAGTTGQLLQTQNSEFPTGATKLVYIASGGSYLYLLDQGLPNSAGSPLYNGAIYIYTVGTSGSLSSVVGGAQLQSTLGYTASINPTVLTVDSQNKFLYVANAGLNPANTSAASNISSYFINTTNGTLQTINGTEGGVINSGIGSNPLCIIEDPSNQYIFTANYNDSSISGKIINTQAGALTPLIKKNTFTAPGNPTWCVASGTTF
jgi:hypothetical protein